MAKRYKRGDQSGKSKMDRKCNGQKIPTGNQSGKLKMAKRYQRVIKAVNWRWTDNTMAKRFQRGNQKKMEKQRSTKHNTEN